jgi:tetratricopeptide (TPR) repeat protein
MKSCLRWPAVVCLALAAAWAQPSNSRIITVRGEIVSSATLTGGLTVELSGDGTGLTETASVNSDNTFEFHSATVGTHELRVLAANGQLLHEEYVSISGPNQALSIRLPEQNSADRSKESTISLRQLSHKVPAAAQKAYRKGEQAAAKGRLEEARAAFQQAVAIDPEFVDAFNELGATEAGLHDLPDAAEAFQKAIDLVPEHRLALPNLCIVLAQMKRFHEAAEVARRALKVVPGAGRIHYILAVSLMSEHGNVDEIILHFERAAADVPSAHVTVAELLAQRGRSSEAIRELEEYLQTAAPGDALRPKAEARLAQLRQ